MNGCHGIHQIAEIANIVFYFLVCEVIQRILIQSLRIVGDVLRIRKHEFF